MKKAKTPQTAKQIYKSNRRKAKVFNRLSPVVYYIFMTLTILFFCLTVQNSIGNVIEITSLLDTDIHTGAEVSQNYSDLINKYGEWIIVGESGGVMSVRFVDVRKALFSGLALTYGILSISCLITAVIIGKVVFKQLAKAYTESNKVLVDTATLKTLEVVEKKEKKKELF